MILPNIQTCIEMFYLPYVQKGAALLDEQMPGWAQKIKANRLNISSSELCICGQLFGSFHSRKLALEDPELYGFTTFDEGSVLELFGSTYSCDCGEEGCTSGIAKSAPITLAEWRALDVLWLDEVCWRTLPESGVPSTVRMDGPSNE